jgi:CheY-like chemotaxis protein
MNGEGRLSIATRNCVEDGQAMVAIDISDTGTGIPPEVQERIFEPFFTTKGTGKGTGLGLSQVYGFATQSGGTVRIDSEVGAGATISILLPCAEPARDVIPEPLVADASTKLVGRILVVEDNVEVGTFAETLLAEQGHEVELVTSAEQALELVRKRPFDLVFSDVVMPGMGGLRLAEILATEQPALPVVLATGYSQEIAEGGARGRLIILKPYRLASLQSAIEEALHRGGGHEAD